MSWRSQVFTRAGVGTALIGIVTVAHSALLDSFDDATTWKTFASDQVTAKMRSIRGVDGKALCLDFDFNGVSGYASLQRDLPLEYTDNYEFSFRWRGNAPRNALQFKLIDASGDNVWWVNRSNLDFPHDWVTTKYKKRQIDFAWGPAADKVLRRSAKIEFTVYANQGGAGEACFDSLSYQALPKPSDPPPMPIARASSSIPHADAAAAIDSKSDTAWRSNPAAQAEQSLTLDLREQREFGGVILHWLPGLHASRYDIETSDDRRHWQTLRRVVEGNGDDDALLLSESQARYLRLSLHAGPGHGYALSEIEIKDIDFGASANAFVSALAKRAPRGRYPRGFFGEQTYWTVVGVDGGSESGLLSEDGAIELSRGGISIDPFLLDEGKLITWADVHSEQSLLDGYLPIPSTEWRYAQTRLRITAIASGTAQAAQLIARYEVSNDSDRSRELTLALAVNPFQVNPPVQFLTTPGGVSAIHDVAWNGSALRIDHRERLRPSTNPDAFFASAFDAGMVNERLLEAPLPVTNSAHDATGLASGVFLYRLQLLSHSSQVIDVQSALIGELPPASLAATDVEALRDAVAQEWREKLDRVGLQLPANSRALSDSVRSALAQILIARDGPQLRPGTRSYARSWIRDGAMIAEALLRLGHEEVASEYLKWYAPYQFASGKVPCCVDARGADPVAENDSHGELIHLITEVYRYGNNRSLLETMWPHVESAIAYMDSLRASERGQINASAERAAFRGMLPASISHEGYSAKPMHSYWDDFWGLAGYKDAAFLAVVLDKHQQAAQLARSRDEFRVDLLASIRSSVAAHAIDYLPGCAELGDFDATSTTIALSPAGEQSALPQELLRGTFERYWREFVDRRDGRRQWEDYTPYEWRTVGSLVRMGWRQRANEVLDFFLADRRPLGWNQWAEVIGRDPRKSRFIGDMPHGWVASDFIRSALDLFAYERQADSALVLAAGIPLAWLDGPGIAVQRLRTPFGALSYTLKSEHGFAHWSIGAGLKIPAGGIVLSWPGDAPPGATRVNGKSVRWGESELRIDALPAEVEAVVVLQ